MWYINDTRNTNNMQKKNKFSLVKISLSSISSKLLCLYLRGYLSFQDICSISSKILEHHDFNRKVRLLEETKHILGLTKLIRYTKYIKVWFATDGLVKVWHFKPSLLICLPYFACSVNLSRLCFHKESERKFKIQTF